MSRIDTRAVLAQFTDDERAVLSSILADIALDFERMPLGFAATLEASAYSRLAREEVFVYRRPIKQAHERARRHLRLSPKRWRERLRRWRVRDPEAAISDAAECGAETSTFPENAHTRTR